MSIATGDRTFEVVSHEPIKVAEKTSYELRVLLCPEEQGFSIFALNLPGIISQGETESEAVANIAEAFHGNF